MIYYNELDQKCCAILRYQIENDSLPPGYVDERSITDVKSEEIKQYRQIHLFAGIGAIPLGFLLAGLPDDVSVYTGGFPCQDLSVAGRRKGLAGERSGLWFEFHRLIASNRPEWVIIENVPGLLSSNAGRDFAIVIGGLTGIIPEVPERGWGNAGMARGPVYTVAYRVLDAQFFGVPQRRRRVFIVASLRAGSPQEILFERESSPWDTPPGREAGPGFAAAITERTRGAGRTLEMQNDLAYALTNPGSGGRPHSRLIALGGKNTRGPIDVGSARAAHSPRYDFERETFITFDTTQITSKQNGSNPQPGDPCHPLSSSAHAPAIADVCGPLSGSSGKRGWQVSAENAADGQLVVDFTARRGTNPLEDLSPTHSTGNGGFGAPGISSNQGVRRLTPLECERLQGFPDDWTKWGCAGLTDALGTTEPVQQSDSARYRQLGNAVAIPVVKWIGKRLKAFERKG